MLPQGAVGTMCGFIIMPKLIFKRKEKKLTCCYEKLHNPLEEKEKNIDCTLPFGYWLYSYAKQS